MRTNAISRAMSLRPRLGNVLTLLQTMLLLVAATTTLVIASGESPVAAAPITGFTQVTAGDNASCAVKTDGTVWCWGRNNSGQLGIGTTSPNASALLDVQSTTQGVRMPNMTTTQKNAIASPAAGLMVFDTTLSKLCVYSGAAWQTITSV